MQAQEGNSVKADNLAEPENEGCYVRYVRSCIQKGLEDMEVGRIFPHDEVKERFKRQG